MSGLRKIFVVVAIASVATKPSACEICDLELTMRVHSDRIVFGDPLYVEVAVVNRGEHPVSLPPPDLVFGTLSFLVSDVTGSFSCRTPVGSGVVGLLGVRLLKPRQRLTLYCSFAMPKFEDFDEPLFWKPLQRGGSVVVRAEYMPWFWQALREEAGAVRPEEDGTKRQVNHWKLFLSAGQYVRLEPRPQSELRVMRAWKKKRFPREAYRQPRGLILSGWPLGPELPGAIPNRFGLENFARQAKLSGELGDWLQVHRLLQDVYSAEPAAREEANRRLVEWLTKEPDFIRFFGVSDGRVPSLTAGSGMREMLEKWGDPAAHEYIFLLPDGQTFARIHYDADLKRQVLARELHTVAISHQQVMGSTAESLRKLIRPPDENTPCADGVR